LHERIEYTPYGEIWVEHKYDLAEGALPYRFTGKELDEETGYYYYGARYLDPRTSRWISTDPAMGDYIPSAPVDDEARKRNGNLPGMGGVFNVVNLHVYHYAGNNPVKYVDPNGTEVNYKKGTDDVYVKYENKIDGKQGEMLEPGKKYPPGENNLRIDGVIAYDRKKERIVIFKINDSDDSPLKPVNTKIRQRKDGSYEFGFSTLWDSIKNWLGGLKKSKDQIKADTYYLDDLPDNHELRSWYNAAKEEENKVKAWEADIQEKANQEKINKENE
ncbi:RHS repeat-associated core domain-containing protein, partial [Treponema sp. R6D11]